MRCSIQIVAVVRIVASLAIAAKQTAQRLVASFWESLCFRHAGLCPVPASQPAMMPYQRRYPGQFDPGSRPGNPGRGYTGTAGTHVPAAVGR